MEAPAGLRMLADVLDLRQSQGLESSESTEVQSDLRRWANEWETMKSLLKEAADSVHESLAETDISDDRRNYRISLESRIRSVYGL